MGKLNIAKILKDCPSGMELNCMVYDDIYFDYIDDENHDLINCYIKYNDKRTSIVFNAFGCVSFIDKAKCVIYPKGKTTWEGFQRPFKDGERFQRPFKDGDILIGKSGNPFIFKRSFNSNYCGSYCGIDTQGNFYTESDNWAYADSLSFATEEDEEKLFHAIKDNGYWWYPKTKELIKMKFKIGDTIHPIENIYNKQTINSIENGGYITQNGYVNIRKQGSWMIAKDFLRPSTTPLTDLAIPQVSKKRPNVVYWFKWTESDNDDILMDKLTDLMGSYLYVYKPGKPIIKGQIVFNKGNSVCAMNDSETNITSVVKLFGTELIIDEKL